MSRTTVRQSVASWLNKGNITGLHKIYQAMPLIIPPPAYFENAGGDVMGAVAFPHVEHSWEHRRATPRVTGWKTVEYDVVLVLSVASQQTDITPGESDPGEASMDFNDGLIDAIKARIRADPKLGTIAGQANEIFSAGEGGESGTPDFDITTGLPVLDNNLWIMWNWLRFRVSEWIVA